MKKRPTRRPCLPRGVHVTHSPQSSEFRVYSSLTRQTDQESPISLGQAASLGARADHKEDPVRR
eukprot:scaffold127350_cov48-Phaeocystis_antarctica.AAC.2